MLRATLFDFDGVLADTEPLHFVGFAEVLARRGIEVGARLYEERYLGLGTDRDAFRRVAEDFARPDLVAAIPAIVAEKADRLARLLVSAPLCEGAPELVRALAAAGPMAVVSGALRGEVLAVLGRHGLDAAFVAIVAAEDVRTGKPDPEGYELGRRRLRELALADLAAAECLAIEDSPNGVAAARAAGMRCAAVCQSRPAEALRDADLVVPALRDLDVAAMRRLFV